MLLDALDKAIIDSELDDFYVQKYKEAQHEHKVAIIINKIKK